MVTVTGLRMSFAFPESLLCLPSDAPYSSPTTRDITNVYGKTEQTSSAGNGADTSRGMCDGPRSSTRPSARGQTPLAHRHMALTQVMDHIIVIPFPRLHQGLGFVVVTQRRCQIGQVGVRDITVCASAVQLICRSDCQTRAGNRQGYHHLRME